MTATEATIPEVPLEQMARETFEIQGQSGQACLACGCRDLRWCGEAFPRCRHCGRPIVAFLPVPQKTKAEATK